MSPLATNNSFLGLAKESVRGTGVAATTFIPVRSPGPEDQYNFYEDKGLRGSMVDQYGQIQGVAHGEYGFSGDFFIDVCPHILMGLLGNSAVAASVATFTDVVLSGTAGSVVTATSPTANFNAALDVGKIVTSTGGTGSVGTTATITAVVSPTVATVTASVGTPTNGTSASFTIARATTNTHTLGLLNNAGATGNQPPSYSVSDFDQINTRQFTAGQFSEFSLAFQPDGLLTYSAKAMGNKSAIVSNPTSSYSSVLPSVGWGGQLIVAGVANIHLESGSLALKRTVGTPFTLTNTQNPYRIWASDFSVSGSFTFIVDDDTELLYYLNNLQPTVVLSFTQPTTGYAIRFQMTACAFLPGTKPERGKEYVEVAATFKAVPNVTDATATGYSPLKTTILNGQASAY